MTDHTPGPWRLEGFKIVGPEHRSWHICQRIATAWYCYRGDSTDVEQNDANARLIASAPAMYDALETLAALKLDGELLAPGEADEYRTNDDGTYEMTIDDAFETVAYAVNVAREALGKETNP